MSTATIQAEGERLSVGDMKPIDGCPGYFILRDGRVLSTVFRKFHRKEPHEVKAHCGKVVLIVGGRKVKRGVKGLVRQAFGGQA